MLETEALEIFLRIVSTQSLTRTSHELRIPRATVSRRLAGLEAKLGVRLLQRTTRSMVLTPAGRAFLGHAEAVVAAAVQAEESVRAPSDLVTGNVRLTMVPGLGLAPLLAEFALAHPAVHLLAHVSLRSVDLRKGDVDVAIRASAKLAPGLVAKRLARSSLVAVASPKYLASRGTPSSLRDLRTHTCILSLDEEMKPRSQWPAKAQRFIRTSASHSNDPSLLAELSIRGLGVAMLPSRLVEPFIANGELVTVLPSVLRVEGAIALVYAERKGMPRQVRTFIDWISARAPGVLQSRSTP